MARLLCFCSLTALFLNMGLSPARAQLQLDVEAGAARSGYNKVRIPGEGGTLIDLSESLESNATFFYRLRLSYTLNEAHTFSVLYAPLTLEYAGTFGQELAFLNTTFGADELLDVRYQFNSYRLTYRYNFPRTQHFRVGVGATAKIRDAVVEVNNVEKTNVGFVPLINFRAEWLARERLSLILTGDALVAPQGRAEDILLAAEFYPNRVVTFRLGYRILEGGANNDEVYNFSLVHYGIGGATITF